MPASSWSNRTYPTAYGNYTSYDPDSDYIVPPVDFRHDYILPDYETAPDPTRRRQFNTRSGYVELDATAHNPLPSTRRSTYRSPYEDKSDYRMVRDAGFNSKPEFMRAYGIKTWDLDAYDRAKDIMDGFHRVDAQSIRPGSYLRSAESSPRSSTIFYDSDLPTCVDSDAEEVGCLSDSDMVSFRDNDSSRRYRSMSSERNLSTSPPARHRRVSFASDREQVRKRSSSRSQDARQYSERSPSTYAVRNEYHARERNPFTSPIRRGASQSPVRSAMSDHYYRHSSRSPRPERYLSRTPSRYAGSDVDAAGYRSGTAGSESDYVYGSDGEGRVASYVSSNAGGSSVVHNESDDEYGDDCVDDGWSSDDDSGGYDEH
jgi:hypothetical protein